MRNYSIYYLVKLLWATFSQKRKLQAIGIVIFSICASFVEIISISATLPFLTALTNPESLFDLPAMQYFHGEFKSLDLKEWLVMLTAFFCATTVMASITRLALLWGMTKFSFYVGADISQTIFRRTLYQPYAVHIARNTSEVISGVSSKSSHVIHGIILPTLNIITSSFILIFVLAGLVAIDPIIAISVFSGFALIYILIMMLAKKRLAVDSRLVATQSEAYLKAQQDGLGGVRDILIDGSQEVFCKIYQDADLAFRKAESSTMFIGLSPRYLIEGLGMVLMAIIAYQMTTRAGVEAGNAIGVMPLLGVLAVGSQRLLPLLQQVYQSATKMRGSRDSLIDTLELLKQPLPSYLYAEKNVHLPFERSIIFKNVSFRYDLSDRWILEGIDIAIPKGSIVGVIGETGSGKSTLMDLFMGLLTPTLGAIVVDDVSLTESNIRGWCRHISHVPQSIFLIDGTISENIAFGVPLNEINLNKVIECAKKACIAEYIDSCPKKYETRVGERGVQLSGGQRQRIGIARALYKNGDVMVFDEATSALDSETEKMVMDSIHSLGDEITILMVAHRLTTLKNCDYILEVKNNYANLTPVKKLFVSDV